MRRELPPEARLLLCCARIALADADRCAALELLAAPLDWERFVALAEAHGLLSLAYTHLDALAPDAVPPPAMAALWGRHEMLARRNPAMAAELLRMLARLDSAGIAAIPYKGPALAAALYGDLRLREFGDLDLLLRRRDVLRAKELLEAQGYRPTHALRPAVEAAFLDSAAQYHLVLAHAEHGTPVELHWKTDPDFPVERLEDEAWWSGLGEVALAGGRVRAFPDAELLLVLCLHGSKHRWSSLGWLVDVAELIRRDPQACAGLVARARDMRCERRVALALHLAHGLLDAPVPGPARAWAASTAGVAPLAGAIAAALATETGEDAPPFAQLRLNLRLYDTGAQRWRHCFANFWEPSLVEWSRWPLPRPLFFLYPPLRLARLAGKHARRVISAA